MKDKPRTAKENKLTAEDIQGGIFFNNNPLPMWVYDLETYRFLAINHAALKHYGYSEDEFKSMTIKDIRPQKDVTRLVENVEHVTGGLDEAGVWRHVKKDGALIFVEIVSHTLEFHSRRAELVVVMDVTERKRAEEALRASESKYHSLFEQTHDAIFILDFQGRHLDVNQRAASMLGYTHEEIQELSVRETSAEIGQSEQVLERLLRGEQISSYERVFRRKDGSVIPVEINVELVRDAQGQPLHIQSAVRDISERKRAEAALRESEEQFRVLFENAPVGIGVVDMQGNLLAFNEAMLCPGGYARADIERIGNVAALYYDPQERNETLALFQQQGFVRGREVCFKRKDGSPYYALLSLTRTVFNGQPALQAIVEDIAERKQAEQALEQSQSQLQGIISSAMDAVITIDEEQNILLFNPAAERMYKCRASEAIGQPLTRFMPEYVREMHGELVQKFGRSNASKRSMETPALELTCLRADGEAFPSEVSISQLELGDKKLYTAIIRDITERKRTEETIRESEDRYRDLVEHIHDLIGTHDLEGNILSINPAASKLLGLEHETLLKMNLRNLLVPEARGQFDDYLAAILRDGQAKGLMYVQTAGGERRIWEYDNTLRTDTQGAPIVRALARDVTERKRAEDALRESEARYRDIFDGVQDAIFMESLDGRILAVNQSACEIYGYTQAEFLDKTVTDLIPEGHAIVTADNLLASKPLETLNRRANGEAFPIEIRGRVETVNGEEVLLVVIRDITERKQAEEKIQRQVSYLTALREIDRAIASTFDMRLSLDSLLAKAVTLLAVDAAAILLVNSTLNTLNYAAGRGFRTYAAQTAEVKLGESYAGRAALERRLIQIPNLAAEPGNPLLAQLLKDEGFVSYHGVPLIVKGKVIGVLEIFNRSFVKRDQEWFDFLETLAGQAAIAIDNAQSFANMQSSNTELIIAYDATIEGWSRAMDLRDKETEGHTQRVTALTLDLARAIGISPAELIPIRRGALLHDIGKMGIPDHILLKPDKLTEEEWEMMRRHPQFAYEMLSPIVFLRSALEIPWCHHEKWDGTGYPRGLKGEQIPLAARIFAVVDVWDALRSDRPYRPAWTKEKALAHIQSQAGSHFDPQVVKAFLRVFAATGDLA